MLIDEGMTRAHTLEADDGPQWARNFAHDIILLHVLDKWVVMRRCRNLGAFDTPEEAEAFISVTNALREDEHEFDR